MVLSKRRRAYLRSPEAAEYRRLYSLKRWKDLRLAILTEQPLCVYCLAVDQITAATVVDHIVPHRGDQELFWNRDNLQGLCSRCHDRNKASEEAEGFSRAVDQDGYPIDPQHPANGASAKDLMART